MTSNASDTKQVNIRLEDEDRKAIDQLVTDGEYENISAFVRTAVKEKLNPKLRRARMRRELIELLKDPEIRRELEIVFPGG